MILSPPTHLQEVCYYSRPLKNPSLWKERMIRLLAGKFNMDQKNRHGKTPLYLAAEQLEERLVKCLLECRANPNLLSGSESKAPLHRAETPEFVCLLSSHGADLNVREGVARKTPLHIAANRGRALVVKALVDEGARVHLVDWHGNTVLHECRTYECAEPVLQKAPSLVKAQNEWGATALHCAIQRERFFRMRTRELDLIRALANHNKADLSLTAMGTAAEVQYGCDLTPLELANRQLESISAMEGEYQDMIHIFSEIVRILEEALQKQEEWGCVLV